MLCGKLSNLRFDGLHQQRTRAAPQDLSEESTKAPGEASLTTLLSDTAYHSFIGEVEALNTTTIRRLTRSRRHQLLAIAPPARPQTLDEPLGPATPTIIVERPVSGIEIELIGGRLVRFDRDIDAE